MVTWHCSQVVVVVNGDNISSRFSVLSTVSVCVKAALESISVEGEKANGKGTVSLWISKCLECISGMRSNGTSVERIARHVINSQWLRSIQKVSLNAERGKRCRSV